MFQFIKHGIFRKSIDLSEDKHGATIIVFAISLFAMLAIIGSAIDIGRAYMVRNKVQSAMDAALLGGVSTLSVVQAQEDEDDLAVIQREMQNLFNANFIPGYMGSTFPELIVTRGSVPNSYHVSVTVELPDAIMPIFGFDKTSIFIESEVSRSEPGSLELTLVLDETGSMTKSAAGGGTRTEAMKEAARTMINSLFIEGDVSDSITISIVPYNTGVNVGASRIDNFRRQRPWNPAIYDGWKDSWWATNLGNRVMGIDSYANPNNLTDAPPPDASASTDDDTEALRFVHPIDHDTHRYRVDNPPMDETLNCPNFNGDDKDQRLDCYYDSHNARPDVYEATEMEFALNSKTELLDYVNNPNFGAVDPNQSSTRHNVGLMWGWYTLSPRWIGKFGAPLTYPKPKDESRNSKVIVWMSDGKNRKDYDNPVVEDLCEVIKDEDIIIYTVAFGEEAIEDRARMEACASEERFYFEAPTAHELEIAFAHIADDILARLTRLSK